MKDNFLGLFILALFGLGIVDTYFLSEKEIRDWISERRKSIDFMWWLVSLCKCHGMPLKRKAFLSVATIVQPMWNADSGVCFIKKNTTVSIPHSRDSNCVVTDLTIIIGSATFG